LAFVVERVHLINARFGYGVGDQILRLFRERSLNTSKRVTAYSDGPARSFWLW